MWKQVCFKHSVEHFDEKELKHNMGKDGAKQSMTETITAGKKKDMTKTVTHLLLGNRLAVSAVHHCQIRAGTGGQQGCRAVGERVLA